MVQRTGNNCAASRSAERDSDESCRRRSLALVVCWYCQRMGVVSVWRVGGVIAIAGVIRVGIGALHLWRLRAQSAVVQTGDLNPLVRATVERAGERRRFEVRVSDQVTVPMAIGFFRPAIVFPRTCSTN